MPAEKTEALVIRLADFSETSKVATLFTREFGKVRVLAKGAKRLKSAFEISLDLLARCQIVFLRKSSTGLDLLTEARLVTRFSPAGHNLASLYGGYYVAELLAGLTEDYDPHHLLYEEAVATLNLLAAGDRPKLHILRFELTILREIGQLPSLDACLACGAAVADDSTYVLWVSQGGLLCRACQQHQHSGNQLPAGTVAVMRRLTQPDADVARLSVSDAQLAQLRNVATSAVSHVMGKRPKMVRYLQG